MSAQLTKYGTRFFLRTIFVSYDADGFTRLPPSSFYVALVGDIEPSISSDGSDLDEPDPDLNPSYDRAEYLNVPENWSMSGYDTISNSTNIEFPIAAEDWGSIRYYAICEKKTGGSVYAFGNLSSETDIISGDRVSIAVGGLAFTMFAPVFEGE